MRRAIYFSSEAKSLLKVLPDLRRLDPVGLGEFFSHGCTFDRQNAFFRDLLASLRLDVDVLAFPAGDERGVFRPGAFGRIRPPGRGRFLRKD